MLPFFTITMTAPAMSWRASCRGTKPSRKASTSLAVISWGDSGGLLVEVIEDSTGREGFGTWDHAAKQPRASRPNVPAARTEYMVPIDTLRFCGIIADNFAATQALETCH